MWSLNLISSHAGNNLQIYVKCFLNCSPIETSSLSRVSSRQHVRRIRVTFFFCKTTRCFFLQRKKSSKRKGLCALVHLISQWTSVRSSMFHLWFSVGLLLYRLWQFVICLASTSTTRVHFFYSAGRIRQGNVFSEGFLCIHTNTKSLWCALVPVNVHEWHISHRRLLSHWILHLSSEQISVFQFRCDKTRFRCARCVTRKVLQHYFWLVVEKILSPVSISRHFVECKFYFRHKCNVVHSASKT